jgi:hypothetical protein
MNTALNALLPSLILLGASYSAAAYSDVQDAPPATIATGFPLRE